MARKSQTVAIRLPSGGLHKATPLEEQPPGTTPGCNNVVGHDSATGRQRLGLRPGKITLGSHGAGTVYHAIPFTAVCSGGDHTTMGVSSGGVGVGIAVCGSNGTFISPDADTFTEHITTGPGSLTWPSQASCALYQGYLYQANSDDTAVVRADFAGNAEADLTIDGDGSVPTNCGIVVRHGNRLWLMGDAANPHVFYASYVGNPRKWDYTDVTAKGAFTSTGSEGGLIGEPIVAGLSQNENTLLIGTLTSVYGVFGNPRGGQIRRISDNVGPLGNNAWCRDDAGNVWMLTSKGLYRIPAGGGQPQPISASVLPNNLIGVDPADGDRVSVGYDNRWPSIHVYVNRSSGTDESYTYDLTTGAFWPQSFSAMPNLSVTFPKIQTDNNSSIIVFDDTSSYQYKRDLEGSDVAESRDSYAFIPLPLPPDGGEALLQAVAASLAKDSGDVAWKIYAANTAEQAFNLASASFTGTNWEYASSEYLNTWQHPRTRYGFAYIRVADVSNARWVVERIVSKIKSAGMLRTG